ncbi:MAG: ribonuclease HI family protein [Anaerolineae bacterium]
MRWFNRNSRTYIVQADGALTEDGYRAGLGVLVRDERGRIVRWLSRRVKGMTNNEAEYAALCLALEALAEEQPQAVHVYSDSKTVVYQMQGRFQVHSPDLRKWHRRACQLARRIPIVTYTHIPRERNQLADALANEALQPPLVK